MADYTSDRTGASIDTVLDNADEGNIGKDHIGVSGGDANTLTSGFFDIPDGVNVPASSNRSTVISNVNAQGRAQQILTDSTDDSIFFRTRNDATWKAWQELYHTGNTGVLRFGNAQPDGTNDAVQIRENTGAIDIANNYAAAALALTFVNPNGQVGSIVTQFSSTQYNTSSDPRLKDFKTAPTDAEVNAKFDDLFGCFKTFNWKNDPDGELVWGFDAHATIDAGLDMGSEGEGSRDLALGDVYDTTPAELDEDGVETKAAIEHKVTPAGVDQSKAVPILLAKIEQLERRLAKAGL